MNPIVFTIETFQISLALQFDFYPLKLLEERSQVILMGDLD